MTATNDPLARVQAMVSAWGETELVDTFDTTTPEVSPLKGPENCGFGHSRHFRHQESEHVGTRHQSAHAHLQERQEQQRGSRVSYSSGVESVESVEKGRKCTGLIFDTSFSQVSKNGGRVSKTVRSAALEAPPAGTCAPADVPAEWVQGVARLAEMPCPARFPVAKWPQVITDAAAFLERWAAQAAALGWPSWELFGCHRRAPWQRLDAMGLVLLLRGKELAALTGGEAAIRTATGAHQTYRRKPADPLHPAERCLVWELGTADGALGSSDRHSDHDMPVLENRMNTEQLPRPAPASGPQQESCR